MNNLKQEFYIHIIEHEAIFDFIQESSLDGFWYQDMQDTNNVWVNPKFTQTLGFPIDSIITWQSRIFPEDLAIVNEQAPEHFKTADTPFEAIIKYLHNNGSTIWTKFRAKAIKDKYGNITRMLGAHVNITQHKEKEIELINTSNRYKEILGNSGNMVFILDPNYVYKEYYQSAEDELLFGSAESLMGKSLFESGFPEQVTTILKNAIDGALQTWKRNQAEYFLSINGNTYWFAATVSAVKNIAINTIDVICVIRDITTKKKDERKLQELALVASKATDAIVIANAEGKVTWANDAYQQLTKFSYEEILGKKPGELLQGPETDQETVKRISAALSNKASVTERIINYTKHGEKYWLDLTINPVFNDNGILTNFIAVERDITQRQNEENEIRFIKEMLEQTNEVAKVGGWEVNLITNTVFWSTVTKAIHEVADDFNPCIETGIQFYKEGENRNTITQLMQEAITMGTAFDVELLLIAANGQEKWVRTIAKSEIINGQCTRVYGTLQDINDLKFAELEVKKASDLLKKLSQQLPGGLFQYNLYKDNTFSLPFASDGLKKILEITDEDIISNTSVIFQRVHPDDLEGVIASMNTAAREMSQWHQEFRIVAPSKGEIWVRAEALPEKAANSIIFHGYIQDITGHKASELQIKQANDQFSLAADAAGFGVWTISLTDKNNVWDDMMFKLYDTSPDEYSDVTDAWRARVHPMDLEMAIKSIQAAVMNDHDLNEEYRIIWKNGEVRYLKAFARVAKNEKGYPVSMTGVTYDITEQKKMEESIIKSELKFRTLYDSTSDAVLLVNETGFFDCNSAAVKLFGCSSKKQLCSLKPIDVTPEFQFNGEKSEELIKKYMVKARASGTMQFEWLQKRIDTNETFPAEVLLNTFLLNEEIVVQIVVRDISKRKQTEKEILEARELAIAASKSKSEFLANMSHEIRTPLNGVIGFTDLLMKTKLDETQQQYMSTVFQSANSLLDIINDILDFSKIEAGKLELSFEQTDIYEVCGQVADMIKFQAHKKKLEMLLNIAHNVPRYIWADTIRIRQIMVNLLSNAVKFTQDGEIELKIELLGNTEPDQSQLRFSVRDTGLGIDPKNQQKIFEAFSQEDASTTRKFGGTGLGLTISNKLLSLMGSKLVLISEPGHGSTFYFDISVRDMQGEAVEWEAIDHIESVLIVDDNTNNRRILRDMLALKNIRSLEAADGREAIAMLQSGHAFDVILLDFTMPGLDGIETIRIIRNELEMHHQHIILLYSSADDEKINAACIELNVPHKMVKPIKIQQLYDALSRLQTKKENTPIVIAEKPVVTEDHTPVKILVTDDSPVNMMLATIILQGMLPYATLFEAENGNQAIDIYLKEQPDIIFMDVQMPEKNGYEAATEIRAMENGSRIPIIALTAGTVKGEREKCIEAGMDDYITKPVLIETIENAVKKWLPHLTIVASN